MTARHPTAGRGALLRDRLGRQVGTAGQLIRTLRHELDACREQNRSLLQQCAGLQQQLARAEVLGTRQAESESRWQHSRGEHEGEMRLRQALERRERGLGDRCARLEAELGREREERRVQQAELQCLQEQVGALRAVLDLLTGDGDLDSAS